jgi:hypothetical protein
MTRATIARKSCDPLTEARPLTPIAVLGVIVAELGFLAYYFSFDLPNAPIPGDSNQHYSRRMVWELAIPGYVPDSPSLASEAFRKIMDWSNMSQRIPILLFASVIVAAALCTGSLIVHALIGSRAAGVDSTSEAPTPIEGLVLAYGLGTSVLSLTMLCAGLLGWMNRTFVWLLLLSPIVAVVARAIWRLRDRSRVTATTRPAAESSSHPAIGHTLATMAIFAGSIAVGLFLAISFLGAMLPATDFDVLEYHLQGPKEFFLAGHIDFSPHNVYVNMPLGTEMLSLLSMIVAGDWWWGALVGQVVLAAFAPMTALGVFSLARRLFSPAAGWMGALVYLTTPWVYRITIIPYTENALCFYLLAAALAATLAIVSHSAPLRLWYIAGALGGTAAACKYPALISTVVPLSVAALLWPMIRRVGVRSTAPGETTPELRPHAWQTAMVCVVGVATTFGPWLAKSAAMTGNPVYPLLFQVFGGRNWSPQKNAKWEWSHRVALLVALGVQRPPEGVAFWPEQSQHAISLRQLGTNLVDVVAKADWQSALVFGLAPLALLSPGRRRTAVLLWGLVAYLFFQWWLLTHRLDRFWVPLLPIAATLAGAGATWSSSRLWRSFLAVAVTLVVFYNFSYCSTALCGYNQYNETIRDRTAPLDSAVNSMNQRLSPSAGVLAVGAADLFHLDRQAIYNTVFDDSIFEELVRGGSPREVAQAFHDRGITHIYVNWSWVARYREPGNYGFTDFVVPSAFRELVDARVLRPVGTEAFRAERTVDIAGDRVPPIELYEVMDQ